MIQIENGIIQLHTQNTSYILSTRRDGVVENIHYGGRIQVGDAEALLTKEAAGYGMDVIRPKTEVALSSLCLELSPDQRGDYRAPALQLRKEQGTATTDYQFATAKRTGGEAPSGGMPLARDADDGVCLTFTEPSGLGVELFYNVFYKSNVITKKMRITNQGSAPVTLTRALSQQLDLPRTDLNIHTLNGAWVRETQLTTRPSSIGTFRLGNNTGASGNRCNPFFFLAEQQATETTGEAYGFNLVYSGSHEASMEVDLYGHTRVLQGVNTEHFSWPLTPGESFVTPEAVLTFSNEGTGGMSRNMHRFVKEHILPPRWRSAPRPVLVNNWEGTYFSFNERKLISMAKVAAKLGAELFVLDDGWFGRRKNDRGGLGDYDVNRKKLPSGLAGLAGKLKALGLDFGLWFEPESVCTDSLLYRDHPDWAIQTPGYEPGIGRYQLALDLCRPEVRRYIIQQVSDALDSADIRYVKWDMNRHISDNYSPALQDQGSFAHKYTLGLYEILQALCTARPDILYEGCSSGGNRYDLGILYYMPQVWISDDSDAVQRQRIQSGASYGYPQCTMGCHVSAVPNHQTLRKTPLDTRFNTAAFGLLGYELDLTKLSATEKNDVAAQIAFYKRHRKLLQYGEFYRLKNPFTEDGCRWMVVAPDQSEAMVGDYLALLQPNTPTGPMRLAGLAPDTRYRIGVRGQKVNIDNFGALVNFVLPVHVDPEGPLVKTANKLYRLPTETTEYTAYGSMLCRAGLRRAQAFSGAGYAPDLRLVMDFASRLYYLQALPATQNNTAPPKEETDAD